MGNYVLVFHGTKESETENAELVCKRNGHNEVVISLSDNLTPGPIICLDKPTAIKFHRELKKQISFLESEVKNG